MSDEARQDDGMSPEEQAKATPNLTPGANGNIPPVEYRFQPGVSGNPAGRKTLGAKLREELNSLGEDSELTEDRLRTISRDRRVHPNRRAAAIRMLKMISTPDLADFAGLLRGEHSLEDMRAMGINTDVIKKFEQHTRIVAKPGGEKGDVEEIINRKIELYNTSGEEFDRATNQTAGMPKQSIDVESHSTVDMNAPSPDWFKNSGDAPEDPKAE